MSERTLSLTAAPAMTRSEARFVVGSVALLSGLALADRIAAWMIGEFPTSAALWELRFAYLRPIGVFYDIASARLGTLSAMEFSVLLFATSVALAAGALSPVRLVRAVCLHVLLASSLALSAYSLDTDILGTGIGSPSSPYALLGAVVALPVLGLCMRVHAEYLGLDQAQLAQHINYAARRILDRLSERLAVSIQPFVPATRRAAVVLVRRNIGGDRLSR
jgi:hypothetical protein